MPRYVPTKTLGQQKYADEIITLWCMALRRGTVLRTVHRDTPWAAMVQATNTIRKIAEIDASFQGKKLAQLRCDLIKKAHLLSLACWFK